MTSQESGQSKTGTQKFPPAVTNKKAGKNGWQITQPIENFETAAYVKANQNAWNKVTTVTSYNHNMLNI